MVESTPMLIRQGDLGYIDLIHEVNELIERRLTEHHGIAFKYTGDGMYAWFLHSADALRCARAVREDLRARNVRSGVPPVVLRTGIAVGQPVDDEGDLFGMTVVVACRLCDRAVDDQILCTVEAADSAGSSVATTFVGELQLKGVGTATACVELG
jgi:class 3 adenylate cyclase